MKLTKDALHEITKRVANYDKEAKVDLKEIEDGYAIIQKANNGKTEINLTFRKNSKGVEYTTGKKEIPKDYLGSICDFIIELMQENDIKLGDGAERLYQDSLNYQVN